MYKIKIMCDLQQSLQEALAQTRQGFVPSLAVDMSALHAVSNNKYTSISRCCQKCVPISKVWIKEEIQFNNCTFICCFPSPDQVLLWRFCQCWSTEHADSWQKKAMVSFPVHILLSTAMLFNFACVPFHSIAVFHSILLPSFHSRGLFGHFFPYTSHVIFTDLKHSHLNDVRKDTFNSKRSALAIFCGFL